VRRSADDCLPQHTPMIRRHPRIPIPQLLQQPRRPLNVSKQERDSPRWQVGSHAPSLRRATNTSLPAPGPSPEVVNAIVDIGHRRHRRVPPLACVPGCAFAHFSTSTRTGRERNLKAPRGGVPSGVDGRLRRGPTPRTRSRTARAKPATKATPEVPTVAGKQR
jgi:hypothetical protein